MREWQAPAFKNHWPLEAQAIRAFKGAIIGERLWCSQTPDTWSSKLQGSEQQSCTSLNAFCFCYWFPLSNRRQDDLGSAKSAFCIISDPGTQKIERTKRNCHLLVVTMFLELLEFIFMLKSVSNFTPRDLIQVSSVTELPKINEAHHVPAVTLWLFCFSSSPTLSYNAISNSHFESRDKVTITSRLPEMLKTFLAHSSKSAHFLKIS